MNAIVYKMSATKSDGSSQMIPVAQNAGNVFDSIENAFGYRRIMTRLGLAILVLSAAVMMHVIPQIGSRLTCLGVMGSGVALFMTAVRGQSRIRYLERRVHASGEVIPGNE